MQASKPETVWQLAPGASLDGNHLTSPFAMCRVSDRLLDRAGRFQAAIRIGGTAPDDIRLPRESDELRRELDTLHQLGFLDRELWHGTTRLASHRRAGVPTPIPTTNRRALDYRVGRDAFLRRVGDGIEIATATGGDVLMLHHQSTEKIVLRWFVDASVEPVEADGDPCMYWLFEALLRVGFVVRVDERAQSSFAFHDRLFQTRACEWRGVDLAGAVPAGKTSGPRPDRDPFWTTTPERHIPLPPGAWTCTCVRARSSIADVAQVQVPSLEAIAALLEAGWRLQHHPDGGKVHRPFVNAGASDELDLYLVVDRCDGLERGCYRYYDAAHALVPCPGFEESGPALLRAARGAWSGAVKPPVLLVLSARPARMSWRYEAIGFKLLLMDAGAALQALSLAASIAGLASCPVGHVPEVAFERIRGSPTQNEFAVAGMLLFGSRR